MSEKFIDFISEDLAEGLKNFLNKEVPEDKFKSYVGKVVDNNDPLKLGRCRIRVYGIFDNIGNCNIPDNDLPWAMPDNTFVGSKVGSFIVPPNDTIVNVYFDDWDVNLPHYSTKTIDARNLPKNYAKNYPDNMIFFETDKGSSFEIDRTTDETTFTHFSGTTITIDTTGAVKIKTHKVEDENSLTSISVPSTTPGGYFCAIPICPHSGQIHISNVAGG